MKAAATKSNCTWKEKHRTVRAPDPGDDPVKLLHKYKNVPSTKLNVKERILMMMLLILATSLVPCAYDGASTLHFPEITFPYNCESSTCSPGLAPLLVFY